jgi:hypothetical protein
MAIHMAEMCLAKAVHPELQTLCQQIITAQQSEIDTLQGWLRDWYDVRYEPAPMSPADQNMMDRLATLNGAEFEIGFLTQMIKHHRRAIVESSVCLKRAYHDDLVSLCEDIIAAQSAESCRCARGCASGTGSATVAAIGEKNAVNHDRPCRTGGQSYFTSWGVYSAHGLGPITGGDRVANPAASVSLIAP